MIPRTPRTVLFTALLVATTLSLGACSDSDDDDGPIDGQDPDGSGQMPGSTPDSTPGGNGGTDGTPGNGGAPTDGSGGGTGDGTDLPDEVASRLERVLSLYRGQPLELAAAVLDRFDAPGSGLVEMSRTPGTTPLGARPDETVEYACSNGGTAISVDRTDADGLVRQRDTTFSGCRVGAFDVDGDARRAANPVRDDLVLPAPYSAADLVPFYPRMDLVLVDSRDGRRVATGADAQAFTGIADPAQARDDILLRRNWATGSGTPLSIGNGDGPATTASLAVGISYADDGAGQIGTVSQSSNDIEIDGDGADGLRSVGTLQPFERDIADANYVTGSLDIGGDGFEYTLDATNGDPDTFQLTVEADGVTTAYTVPWSDRYALETFQPSRVDLGF